MKETGIIMSGDHPTKILDGTKTMSRRVIKPQPEYDASYIGGWVYKTKRQTMSIESFNEHRYTDIGCPYGQVGDRLWVRETFVLENDSEYGYSEAELKEWAKDRPIYTEDRGLDWGIYHLIPHYRATEPEPNIVAPSQDTYDDKTRWAPSRFMPRWASRITLEITGVRAERLQEIMGEDCVREGITLPYRVFGDGDSEYYEAIGESYIQHFRTLWDSLNAKRGYGWETNPWVWVISFIKLKGFD